jgi:hypothetical protein
MHQNTKTENTESTKYKTYKTISNGILKNISRVIRTY